MTMMGPRPSMGRWTNGSKLESDGEGGREYDFPSSTWHLEPASRRAQRRPRSKQGSWRAESMPRMLR